MSLRSSLALSFTLALTAVVLPGAAVAATTTTTPATTTPAPVPASSACPATFQVLHSDRVGTLKLPAGAYTITTSGALTCSQASKLFNRFLEDWDGVLPSGWKVKGSGFQQGTSTVGFTVKKTSGGGGGGGGSTTGSVCPGTFQVVHNDQINALKVPAGPYLIYVIGKLTCRQVMNDFRLDLDKNAIPPKNWTLNTQTATFLFLKTKGFRVEPANGI